MPKIVKTTPKTATATPKKTGILSKVKKVAFDENEGISIMLYGESGSGKTTTWSSFPGRILAIICSGGNRSGELRSLGEEEREKTDTITLSKPQEFMEIVEALESDSSEYSTVVLDHVSGHLDLVLSDILGKPVPEQKSWGMATQQDYGTCSARCKDGLRKFLNLPINRVVIGQQRESERNEDSELLLPTVGVALTPSLAGWLYPACDYVVQTFKKQKMKEVQSKVGKEVIKTLKPVNGAEYCARIGPSSIYQTKFRKPKSAGELPDYIVDPTYDKIMEIIKGEA